MQLVASEERLSSDSLQNFWQSDGEKLVARMERILRNVSALSVTEVDVANLETKVAHLSVVALTVGREFASELQAYSHRLLFGLQTVHTLHGLCRHNR